ncbi:DUF262 domain-containing protein [Microcoleus sp. FACHB-53]|nr:DUF262 domain-containing protein [Microcoleus sp. FACHB-53]
MATIESHDFTLEKLFNDFYVVLDYQREYVWEEEHVNAFLNDIFTEFSSNRSSPSSEYFIGSIIVCVRENNVYELIDGQQRMTTAYLALCAIRDYRKNIKPDEPLDSIKSLIASTYIDDEGDEKSRNRVELQYEDSRGVLEKIALQENFDDISETSSVQNIKNAYYLIYDFLVSKFGQNEEAVQKVKRFYAYFIKNVKVVRVETPSMAHALTVFATINNRGVGLDAMDLLKNLMFMQVKDKEFERLKNKWKKMIDTLFEADEKPLRFLRYFILARYDAGERLREDGIYDWLSANKELCGYRTRPIAFVDELLKAAQAFVKFKNGQDSQARQNRYLVNIGYLSTKQHLMLLLAGQRLHPELFTELSRHIENLLFAYIITREGTNKLETLFTLWTAKLRQVQDKADFDTFIADEIQPTKQKLAERFELAFRKLDESSMQKKMMHYILAKLTQYIDELAWGSSGAAVELKTYINKKVTVEHILPQNTTDEIKLAFDKANEIDTYIKRLGNLTLLEKSINAAISNKPFEFKKQAYPQSNFLITKSIPKQVIVGIDTAVDRAVKDLESFEEWNSKSIERRQEMLTQLAKKVWDIH